MKLNLNGWKKVNSEKDHSILQNKDGHQLKVLHKALGKDVRHQLDKLEFADGGKVPDDKLPATRPKAKSKDDVPDVDPKKAKEFVQGATDSGWRPAEWKQNLKAGLGLAKGGMAHYDEGSKDGPVSESDLDTEESPDDTIPVGTMPMTPQPDAPIQMQADPKALPEPEAAMPEPQASVPPVDPAGTPPPGTQAMDEAPTGPTIQGAYDKHMQAAKTEGDVTAKLASDRANIEHKAAQQDQIFMAKRQADHDEMAKEALAGAKDIADNKIDSSAYWKDHSKILSAIGIALSSFGGTGEQAMNFLNKAIERNVDDQKANLANKKNLLAMRYRMYGDKTTAEDSIRVTNAAYVAHMLGEAADKAGTQLAESRKQQMQAQIMSQYAPVMERAATIKTLNSGAAAHMDPANFLSIAKPDQQKAVADVMDVAKETKKASVGIMSAFERAANDNTLVKSMGGIRTPGSVMAMHALLGPTFKDVEGTVRQAAMDNLYKNVTPSPGDSEKKIQEKRQALVGYIQSKGASSLAKANGIDLDKFDATRPLSQKELLGLQNGGADEGIAQPQFAMKNGVKYQKVAGGWKAVR